MSITKKQIEALKEVAADKVINDCGPIPRTMSHRDTLYSSGEAKPRTLHNLEREGLIERGESLNKGWLDYSAKMKLTMNGEALIKSLL